MNNLFIARLRSLPRSSQRVYSYMRKGGWKHSVDIKNVAGTHLSEGLRRMRDLRSLGIRIDRKRAPGSFQFMYRIAR
jgi:hypothetical protein